MKRELTRTLTLVSLVPVMLFTLAVILTTTPVLASTIYTYNFDSTLSPWMDKGDSGISRVFSLESGDSGPNCSSFLNNYAQLANTTPAAPGQGLWMYAPFSITAAGPIEVKWDSRDAPGGGCGGNCEAIAFIGSTAPSTSSVFSSRGTLSTTWQGFSYSYTPAIPLSTAYVAVGWRVNSNSTADVTTKVRFDCIKVAVP